MSERFVAHRSTGYREGMRKPSERWSVHDSNFNYALIASHLTEQQARERADALNQGVAMTGGQKRKGDRCEREVEVLLRQLLELPARRKLGAGRHDDMGDIDGVPETVIQCASWGDALRAVREKPEEAERQREVAEAKYAASFIRLRGGSFRVVLTPEQWATLWKAAAA